jgi:predicted exporter
MSARRLIPVALWLICLLLSLGIIGVETRVTSDLSQFFPRAATPYDELLLRQLGEGPAARLILIAVEGGAGEDRVYASKRLAEALPRSGLFRRVMNGETPLPAEERERLFAYRYLLSPQVSAERFAETSLRTALRQRLHELATPLSLLEKPLLPADPTGDFLSLLQSWRPPHAPLVRDGVWVSADGKRALLLAETKASSFDLDAQERAVGMIRRLCDEADRAAGLSLSLSGPGAFAVESKEIIRTEASLLSGADSIIILALMFLAYRSWRPLMLCALPLASGLLVAVALVSWLFRGIHGITLIFGTTLMGVAMDYPAHVFSHLHAGEGVERTLVQIWPTIWLGAFASATGFLAMLMTDFTGLIQLGAFSVIGLLVAAVCTRWVLPALLPADWTPRRDPANSKWLTPWLRLPRLARLGAITGGVIAAGFLWSMETSPWDDDLAALSPVPQRMYALDAQLRAELGAPDVSHLVVVTATDAEGALQRSEALVARSAFLLQRGWVGDIDYAARYLPSVRTQRLRQAQLPSATALETTLGKARRGLPFRDDLFRPFLRDVVTARTLLPLRPSDVAETWLGLRIAPLLFEQGDRWHALLLFREVREPTELAAWFNRQGEAGARYFNLKAESDRLIAGFRSAAVKWLAMGSVVILLVLWLACRSLRHALRSLLPVALALVMTVAILLASGQRLSLFHLISLLLVLGVSIDYSLFFNRSDERLAMRKRTLHAVILCAGSTVSVFGILALSQIPVLAAIGRTVAIGVSLSFLLALVMARTDDGDAASDEHRKDSSLAPPEKSTVGAGD